MRQRNIALITPWPPQHTGIADYAFDLAIGLAQQDQRVTVYTDAAAPAAPGNDVRVLPITSFTAEHPHDCVVYQMGNNATFHCAMIPLLAKIGGIVHLHDMVLHHLLAYVTCGQGRSHLYYRLLRHWYSHDALEEARAWHEANRGGFWDSNRVTDIPLFEPIVHYARGCIMHSQFSRSKVETRLPNVPCRTIPQVYRNAAVVGPPGNTRFKIGVFGIVQPNKHVDKVLRSVAHACELGADIELEIVGSLGREGDGIRTLLRQLGIERRTVLHGHAGEADFLRVMQSIDLCVSLRYPTMGETSAIVSRTMQMGIPTIVNRVGWYAELPALVHKVSTEPDAMQNELNAIISQHTLDPAFHQQCRQEAARYAQAKFDFQKLARQYVELLDELQPLPASQPRSPSMSRAA